jgi:hypothetical protein
MMWTGFAYLSAGISGEFLLTPYWIFGSHKSWGISWLAGWLLGSQEVFCPVVSITGHETHVLLIVCLKMGDFKKIIYICIYVHIYICPHICHHVIVQAHLLYSVLLLWHVLHQCVLIYRLNRSTWSDINSRTVFLHIF